MLSVKPWRANAVLHFGVALLFCVFLGGLASLALERHGAPAFRRPDDFGPLLLGTLCFQGAAWPIIYLFLRRHQTTWLDAFGWRGPELKRALKQALLVILVVLPVAWLLQGMSVLILTWLGHPPDEQAAVKLLEAAQPWWTRAYLAVFAIVLAPLAEEFIFRGLLYPFVKQLGWPRLALFGVSGLFALIHFDVATFLPLFVLALALTWLYEKTDNLLAPITVHALFNSANLVVLAAQQWSDAHGKA